MYGLWCDSSFNTKEKVLSSWEFKQVKVLFGLEHKSSKNKSQSCSSRKSKETPGCLLNFCVGLSYFLKGVSASEIMF